MDEAIIICKFLGVNPMDFAEERNKMKESVVKSMRIKVEGKSEVLNNLEKAERLIDQARDILYRTPTQIKVVVEECDEEEKITCSQDTR